MNEFEIEPAFAITNEKALRALYPATHKLAGLKSMDRLDGHARDFIARSPFLCLGTQNNEGGADVSPRGDPPGFVQVLDDRTLAIPDRPGNNRLDSLANIVKNRNVGLLFFIPGFDDTLRVNGRATLVNAPEVLDRMTVNDRAPTLAVVVRISEVFLHCAKAFRRSQLWNPEQFQDRAVMPSLMNMLLDQTTGAPTDAAELRKRDEDLEEDYRNSMY